MFGNFLDNLRKSTGECKNKHSDKFPKFLKIFRNLRKSLEIFGSLRKSSKVFGKNRKMSESSQNDLPFWKSSEVFGSVRKCSENFGNPRKIFECNQKFMKKFYTVPISDICGLKIRFNNFDL